MVLLNINRIWAGDMLMNLSMLSNARDNKTAYTKSPGPLNQCRTIDQSVNLEISMGDQS